MEDRAPGRVTGAARSRSAPNRVRSRVPSSLAVAAVLLLLSGCRQSRWTEPVTGMEFVSIPAGRFIMGSPPSEVGHEAGELQHEVVLSHAFYLGTTEVTQGQWRTVMGSNPSHFSECGPNCPVERVNYFDVQSFIRRLETLSGQSFRLPTEAEWEYACRAGTTTPFSTGENLTTDEANYDGEFPYAAFAKGVYRARTTTVGSFPPNPWGLYDMNGNVWEWTQDWNCPYSEGRVTDPLGVCAAQKHIIRGGSWYFNGDSARCAVRYTHRPKDLGFSLGFRLVASRESKLERGE